MNWAVCRKNLLAAVSVWQHINYRLGQSLSAAHIANRITLMKIKELTNLSKEELVNKEKELRGELFKLNLQRYAGRVEKPHMFKIVKRDIARIQTLLSAAPLIKKERQDK